MLPKHNPMQNEFPEPERELTDRSHALFVIVRSMQMLGFGTWTHIVLSWLGNYDGLETRIAAQDDPVLSVRELFLSYTTSHWKIDESTILVDLCQLNFVRQRAAWIDESRNIKRHWLPLEQPWLDFSTQGRPGEALKIWSCERSWLSVEQIRCYLVAKFIRLNGLR